jgi:hypothetical protein
MKPSSEPGICFIRMSGGKLSTATFRWPARLANEFSQERVVFVFLFLSDLTALVAELTARNFLIFEQSSVNV